MATTPASSDEPQPTSKSTKPKKKPTQKKDPLREDFRNFLFVVWKHLNLLPPTKRQYEIAWYLQHGPKRKMVRGFRGIAKSWITCAYVAWSLYCDPQKNILIVSASKSKSDEFNGFIKRLISEMDILAHLRPRGDQRWSAVSFDVNGAEADPNPSVKSAGITGQVTGTRADEIIADDIETSDNALTQGMREKLSEKVKEFDAIIKPGEETRITYLGTPQTEQSIYDLLPERGYDVRVWTARYPDAKQRPKYADRLSPGISQELEANPALAGHSTEPTRFTDMDLAEREASWGRSGFALQFMLDTSFADADRYPLKLRDLLVAHLDSFNGPEKVVWAASPEWIINDLPNVGIQPDRYYRPVPLPGINYLPYTGAVMTIDPAGTGKDETSWAIVKTLHGFLFLLDAGGFPPGQGHSEETLEGLAKLAERYQVNKIIIEANFGDGMFSKLLQPKLTARYPVGVEEVKHNTSKERRICDTLEPVIQSHRLVVNADLIERDFASTQAYSVEHHHRYQLFFQLTRITRDRGALAQDDRLDAVAMAVAYWSKALSVETDKAVDASRAIAMQKELDNYLKHAIGGKPRGMIFAPTNHR